MKQEMYVIATRGKNNKEIYLKATEKETRIKGDKVHIKILCEWTENIGEAIATFEYSETEKMAKNYFINYKKWYVKSYQAEF